MTAAVRPRPASDDFTPGPTLCSIILTQPSVASTPIPEPEGANELRSGDYTNHMASVTSDSGERDPLETTETASANSTDLESPRRVKLPVGCTAEQTSFGFRSNIVLTGDGFTIAAVCDLVTGEYVLHTKGPLAGPRTELVLRMLAERLGHLRTTPPGARRSQEGALRQLADLTGGTWFAYETVRDIRAPSS